MIVNNVSANPGEKIQVIAIDCATDVLNVGLSFTFKYLLAF